MGHELLIALMFLVVFVSLVVLLQERRDVVNEMLTHPCQIFHLLFWVLLNGLEDVLILSFDGENSLVEYLFDDRF